MRVESAPACILSGLMQLFLKLLFVGQFLPRKFFARGNLRC